MSEANGAARRIGRTSAVSLVIANMIGAGVFTTSGFALAELGSRELVLLAWVAGGLLAACGALSYGALARRIPVSGGEYTFLSRIVHPLAGFLAGWVSLLAGFTAPIAAAALGLQAYLAPLVGADLDPRWLGTAAILLAGAMHGVAVGPGLVLQNTAVAVKLLVIGGFVAVGALAAGRGVGAPAELPEAGGLAAFGATLVWISFSYSGWNAAVYVASEVRDPDRNLDRSLWLATGIVTAVYLALNAVFVYAAPAAELAGRADVGAVAARAIGGDVLARLFSALVALALFTSVSSMVLAGPRVYARMAEEGLFPPLLAGGDGPPRAATALQVGLAIALVWWTGLVELFGYIGFTLGISAAATVAALVALRLREGARSVPVPLFPWVPAVFIAGTLGAAAFLVARQPAEAGLGLLTVAAGVPLYAWLRRRPDPRAERSAPRRDSSA